MWFSIPLSVQMHMPVCSSHCHGIASGSCVRAASFYPRLYRINVPLLGFDRSYIFGVYYLPPSALCVPRSLSYRVRGEVWISKCVRWCHQWVILWESEWLRWCSSWGLTCSDKSNWESLSHRRRELTTATPKLTHDSHVKCRILEKIIYCDKITK
jgi:hypothetical protein